MEEIAKLPYPQLDALPLGAHRALRALTDERLFAQMGVRVAFASRAGGVSEGPYASLNCWDQIDDDERAVLRNREIVMEALGVPEAPLVVPLQVHGTRIVQVEDPLEAVGNGFGFDDGHAAGAGNAVFETGTIEAREASSRGQADMGTEGAEGHYACSLRKAAEDAQSHAAEGADCVLVKPAGLAALLNFADCLPLILVAPGGAFAVAHAGWRGAVAHMARLAAEALAEASGEDPSQFNAYIGPHIRSECFEVGLDVAQIFADEFGQEVLSGERHVSLTAAVTCDLVRAGLDPERVADACICTKCHPDEYFSYRATGGLCGRNAAAAVRLP